MSDNLTAALCSCSMCSTASESRLVGSGTAIPLSLAEARGLARRAPDGSWEVRSGSRHEGPFISLADAAEAGWVVTP